MKTSSQSAVMLPAGRRRPWEYRSRPAPGGLPWIHVSLGGWTEGGYRPGVARGVLALGDVAIGLLAFGGVAVGLLGVGGVALGLVALGGVAAGLAALGAVAIGVTALGAVAVGVTAHAAAAAVVLPTGRFRHPRCVSLAPTTDEHRS